MRLRYFLGACLLVFAVIQFLPAAADAGIPDCETEYGCDLLGGSCKNTASCDGDSWEATGGCSLICYCASQYNGDIGCPLA